MNLSEPFIRRPVATSLLMAAVAFLGIVAFRLLPVAPLPQVDFPTVQVTATLAGASAETMAASVATPLERQLGQIAGVTQLTSFSTLGATSITIQFDLNRNIDLAAQDVQAAITAASKTLPQTMTAPPTYKKLNPADAPILILSARSDTMPLTLVDQYADSYLAQQISQVSGVAQVALGGEQRPSIRVQVDPAKLASLGLTLEDIRGALVTATTDAPKGSLTTGRLSFTIEANDQITDADQFKDVIVSYRNGAPIRVRDIGSAVAAATDRFSAAYHNNDPAILLSVYKQPGANVIDTVEAIKKLLPKVTAVIPSAIQIATVLDLTTTRSAPSARDVSSTGRCGSSCRSCCSPSCAASGECCNGISIRRVVRDRCISDDVSVLLQFDIFIHGADDRDCLRDRRCDCRGRERLTATYPGAGTPLFEAALDRLGGTRFDGAVLSARR